jgi:hypothetical protein
MRLRQAGDPIPGLGQTLGGAQNKSRFFASLRMTCSEHFSASCQETSFPGDESERSCGIQGDPRPVALASCQEARALQEEGTMKNSVTLHYWAWFSGIVCAALAFLYWVSRRTTPPEVLWKKPPIWHIVLLLALLGFIVYLFAGPH